ncbi:DNA-binding GntR family transcriptional regulator [Providencia alcalifaciens]|nr:DNA-binding GntR family transcriptional regulator [Providencia alcalifaciens]
MMTSIQRSKVRPEALTEKVYQALKNDIFELRLMPVIVLARAKLPNECYIKQGFSLPNNYS